MTSIDDLCLQTIRSISAELPSVANSGHPGAPLGCAPIAHTLWTKHMNYSSSDPHWFNRDRFILSNGHACALLYTMLHLCGYDLSIEDLKQFRQIGSKTPGHPELGFTPGVESTTGPLGQGLSNAVGMAIASKHMTGLYNRDGYEIFNSKIYVLVGDGCLQEGVASEACSLAGHLKLNNLIVLYDDNNITIDGSCNLSFTENVEKRFESYGWKTLTVTDGDSDYKSIDERLKEANLSDCPTLIRVRTTIGYGSVKQNTHQVHGTPLNKQDLQSLKEKCGFDRNSSFYVPETVKEYYTKVTEKNELKCKEWKDLLSKYKKDYPDLYSELNRRITGDLPVNWRDCLPVWKSSDASLATRQTSQRVLNSLAEILPEIIGGSADLTPSNLTNLSCTSDFTAQSSNGRYLRFGVREHAMAAICNGIAAFGGFIPFAATFLNFIQYALGAVRLSALSHLRVIYIMTHDSIALGEDGPTHQPINALAMLRSIPNLQVIRPCDGNETSGAYEVALSSKNTPTVLVFSRQSLPQLSGSRAECVSKGAYTVYDSSDIYGEGAPIRLVFVATGSETTLCVKVSSTLPFRSRVVSMPCTSLFDCQSIEYKKDLLLDSVAPVISCEALSVKGWHEYSHVQHGMTTFGVSGPGPQVMEHFGFNVQDLTEKALKTVEFYTSNPIPSLFDRPIV